MPKTFSFDVLVRATVALRGKTETEARDKLTALAINPRTAATVMIGGEPCEDCAIELPLFSVRYDGDDGDNFDLFVRAQNPGRAERVWREYFSLGDHYEPDRIDEIPLAPRAGAIPWERVQQVQQGARHKPLDR